MRSTQSVSHTGEARERILAAAAEVFAEHGFAGAGVDEIARRAGINKAMLYYHVGDKAALFGEVVKTNIAVVGCAVAEAVGASSEPRERLRAIPRAFARVAVERPFLPQLMLREIAGGGPNIPEEALSQIADIMGVTKAVLEDGRERGAFRRVDPFVIHLLLIGSLMFIANALRMRQRFGRLLPFPSAVGDLEALTDRMVEIALDGITVQGA